MRTFSYKSGDQPNEALFVKSGFDKPSYSVDFKSGMGSGVTLGAISIGAVDNNNANALSQIYSGVTSTGSVATIALLVGSTGTSATDGARFRIRTFATLSDSRVLTHDCFVYVNNPTYNPD